MLLRDIIERYEREKGRKIGEYPIDTNTINVTYKIGDWDTAETSFQPTDADDLIRIWNDFCDKNGFWIDSVIEIEELYDFRFTDICRKSVQMLLSNDDRVVQYMTTKSPVFNTGSVLWNVIIPKDEDPNRTDLGSCLEDTLHRMLDARMSKEEIFAETGMYSSNYPDEDDIPIDLGFYLSGSIIQLVA